MAVADGGSVAFVASFAAGLEAAASRVPDVGVFDDGWYVVDGRCEVAALLPAWHVAGVSRERCACSAVVGVVVGAWSATDHGHSALVVALSV